MTLSIVRITKGADQTARVRRLVCTFVVLKVSHAEAQMFTSLISCINWLQAEVRSIDSILGIYVFHWSICVYRNHSECMCSRGLYKYVCM